ncbi:MAG: putative lipid II flippase FtsW [Peptostreptococcaceae bacterium]|nr:putative lipid II flippase FtsW [Peptostreptococcaceae bacterium]
MEQQNNAKTMVKSGKIDWSILIIVYILVFIGILMIFSASSVQAQILNNSSTHFLKKQCIYVFLGTIALIIVSNIDYRIYKKNVFLIYFINIVLLVLTLSPLGVTRNDAQRWIGVGNFTLQTSDFTKIAMIITTAFFIDKYREKISTLDKLFVSVCALVLPLLLIIKQPSFSAMMTIALTNILMLFIGGMSMFVIFLGLLVGGILAFILILIAPYRMKRLTTYLNPFSDPNGAGWQIINSFYAISSGGILGRGFGKSTQKYFYISQPQNDFIFAVIAEELGLIRSMLIILLYVVLIFKIFRLSLDIDDIFAKMLVLGIALQTGVQVVLNIGVATGLLPNTGVGLPFISYGGTSVVMFLIMFGILLNVSKHRKVTIKNKTNRLRRDN